MTHEQKQRLIDRISWGCMLIDTITADDQPIHFILHPPTAENRARAALVYDRAYYEAVQAGMDTEEQAIQTAIEIGQWDQKTEQVVIPGLRKDIHNIRRGLLDLFFQKTRLEQARSLLRRAEEVLMQKLQDRTKLLIGSADTFALLQQQSYVISCITTTENGERYWLSRTLFDNEVDTNLVRTLIHDFFTRSKVHSSVMREIARSEPWRAMWMVGKELGNIFHGQSIEWSEAQQDLVHWSHVYDMVYEAYERPAKAIIEDDDLLDSWFIRQSDKVEKSANKSETDDKTSKNKRNGRQEQFVVADREGAQQVYALNDPHIRTQIQAKQQFLAKRKIVDETDLPESQMEMRQLAMDARQQKRKDISHR